MTITRAILAAVFLLSSVAARAELAVSANDGKQIVAGDPTGVTPDSVSVIELGPYPPRVIGTVEVPAAMIGPPAAVAVGHGFALVTASQRFDPDNPMKPLPDNKLSVIDLSQPAHPRLLQGLSAGAGASGVSINALGTLALVANRNADSISIFTISGKRLTPAGTFPLDAGAEPTDVVFTPDGKTALAVAQGSNKIIELVVDGSALKRTGNDVAPGKSPYGAVVTPDGAYLINTNVGGAAGNTANGTVTMIDLRTHRLVASVEVGKTPEHVALSPDGRYIAVVLANGTATSKSDPSFATRLGILRVLKVGDGTLTEVAQASTGHWGQGATWSDDGTLILLQCATERQIEVYHFDGATLAQDKSATLQFQSRPGAISTFRSR